MNLQKQKARKTRIVETRELYLPQREELHILGSEREKDKEREGDR